MGKVQFPFEQIIRTMLTAAKKSDEDVVDVVPSLDESDRWYVLLRDGTYMTIAVEPDDQPL